MNKWLTTLGILSAILLGGLLGGSSVSAASVFDDTVTLTDELIVSSGSGKTYTDDITMTWGGILANVAPTCYSDFQDAMDYGSYAVMNYKSDIRDEVWIVYSTDPYILEFFDAGGGLSVITPTNTQADSIYIYLNNSTGEPQIQCSTTSHYIAANFVWSGYTINTFLSTYGLEYPAGYEGEIIPDSYTPPPEPEPWTPKMNVVNVFDWKIALQDQNFNTFDNVPFTCNDGLTPVIQYDFYNNDTDPITKIDSGVFSPTIPYEFQSENYGIETEYKFIGNYYCGIESGQPTFSGQTTYYFTINASGYYVPPTDSCYTDTFPFIDMNGCTGVLEDLLNNLSFGAITFPNWSVNNDSCHSLGIIGDWLNVPASSRTVCPQFPETVRSIVTPFLTFVLGITILGVIVTKSQKDTH